MKCFQSLINNDLVSAMKINVVKLENAYKNNFNVQFLFSSTLDHRKDV